MMQSTSISRFKAKTTKKTLQLCSIFEEQAADNLPAEQVQIIISKVIMRTCADLLFANRILEAK